MAATNLKEFLVSCGWRIDEASWKRFNAAVGKSTTAVTELGAETVAAGTAIGAMVTQVARQYQELGFVSQRTGASVANLKAFQFGFRQIGLSSEEATSSIESFASALRMTPGLGAMFGLKSGDDPTKQYRSIVKRLRAQFGEPGYFMAARFAAQAGMPEQLFRSLWVNEPRMEAAEEHQRQLMKRAGINADEATAKFDAFGHSLNNLGESFSIWGQRIALDWVAPAKAVVEGLDEMLQKISELDAKTGGAVGIAEGVGGVAAGGWVAKKVWSRVFRQKAAEEVAKKAAADAAKTGAAEAAGGYIGSAVRMAGRLFGPLGILLGSTEEAGTGEQPQYVRDAKGNLVVNPNAPVVGRSGGIGSAGGARFGGATRGDRNNNPGNIEYGPFALKHGAVGTDGRFAVFPDKATGEEAMDALLASSGYRGLSLGQIQRKWVGYPHANYTAGLERSTGLSQFDTPNMGDPEMRRRVMRGMALGEGTHMSSGDTTTNNVTNHYNITSRIETQPGKPGAEAASNIFSAGRAEWLDILSNVTRYSVPNTR